MYISFDINTTIIVGTLGRYVALVCVAFGDFNACKAEIVGGQKKINKIAYMLYNYDDLL